MPKFAYVLWRLLAVFTIAFAPLFNLAAPASAFLYSAPLTVSNNSSATGYTMLPVVTPLNTTFLTTYGFMASSANDTRVQTVGGVNLPVMVSDNAVMTALPVPVTSQTNLLMTTGNSAQAMSIITGYNGYFTTPYAAALNTTTSGEIEWQVYLDATNTVGFLLDRNNGAGLYNPRVYMSSSGVMRAYSTWGVVWDVSVYGVTSGWKNVKLSWDGVNATLNVAGSTNSTAAVNMITGGSGDFKWNSGNIAPYAGYLKFTVDGTLVIRYEPVTVVGTTVLPDRAGAAQNAIITWGSNPYPVSSNISSLAAPVIAVVPAVQSGTTSTLPAAGGFNTNQEPGVDPKLLTNPLRPIIQIISLNTSVTEAQAWVYAALVIVLLPFPMLTRKFKGHYVLTAVLTCVMLFFVCAMGMWPWWALVFMAPILLGGIVAERAPWI